MIKLYYTYLHASIYTVRQVRDYE